MKLLTFAIVAQIGKAFYGDENMGCNSWHTLYKNSLVNMEKSYYRVH